MGDEPVLAVRGESTREVDPEVATFVVNVGARSRNQGETLQRLQERLRQVLGLLDGYRAGIEKRDTGGISVYPETKKGSGERVASYIGQIGVTVTVADFAILGEVMPRLAELEQVSLFGLNWALRPDSPVYRDARRAAITDAIARARDYADALGARVLGLDLLADSGLGGSHGRSFEARSVSMGYRGGGETPTLDLEPQRQQVQAQIEARFRISPPTVLAGPAEDPVREIPV
jgi:uncharacterized protein